MLERVCGEIGYPKTIRVDQGTEFVSRDLDLWAYHNGVTLDFSRPGKPTDNAFIEAFNGKFRAECLNAHWFMSLDDAREKMEDWRRYYNEERPHGGDRAKTADTCCTIPVAHPARHRERAGKLYPPAVQKNGLRANVSRDSTHRWMKLGAEVRPLARRA